MNIRLAHRDDLPAIVDIANWYALHSAANFAHHPEPLDLWVEQWERSHEFYPWFVADDGGSSGLVGFAKAGPFGERFAYRWAALCTVYLHPDHRGQGIGRALYAALIECLRRQGYCTAIGGITLPNPVSVALHERFGFQPRATFRRVGWKFGQWHDVGYWQLPLIADEEGEGEAPASILRVEEALFGAK